MSLEAAVRFGDYELAVREGQLEIYRLGGHQYLEVEPIDSALPKLEFIITAAKLSDDGLV